MKSNDCPICGNPATVRHDEGLYDDRYGYPGLFALRRCPRCDHRFLEASFTAEQIGELYTRFYPRGNFDLETWRVPREMGGMRRWLGREGSAVFRWVPRDVKVLDVGCGTAESVAYHASRGCDAEGVEADQNVRRIAERFGLKVRVGLFRAEDFPRESFDVVTLDQVIEHVTDPVALLREAAEVLRPGGKLLLSTPNARSLTARWLKRRWVHGHTPYHLQLFSETSLRRAAQEAGLTVEGVRYVTHPRWYGFQWLHLLSRPAPGQPSRFWTTATDWPLGLLVVRKLVSGLGRLGLNHVVAMVLDGLRCGDNFVVFLRKP